MLYILNNSVRFQNFLKSFLLLICRKMLLPLEKIFKMQIMNFFLAILAPLFAILAPPKPKKTDNSVLSWGQQKA